MSPVEGSLGARAVGLVALLVALPVVLAGCGSAAHRAWDTERLPNGVAEMTPEEALRAAYDRTTTLEAARYKGTMVFPFETGERKVRVEILTTGIDYCEWKIRSDLAGTTTMRAIRGTTYWKPDDTALRVGWGFTLGQREFLDGRWILWKTPDNRGPALCATGDIIPTFTTWKGYRAAGEETVGGRPTVRLTLTGEEGRAVHIATQGDPLVVRSEWRDSQGPVRVDLVEVDPEFEFQEPPESEVIDPSDPDTMDPPGSSVDA